MADFITLTCPSCGGKLQITNEIERFACAHCGNEHVVKRTGGIVLLAPVIEGLGKVQIGVDRTASELAIRRLRDDISRIYNELREIKMRKGKYITYGIFSAILGILIFGILFMFKASSENIIVGLFGGLLLVVAAFLMSLGFIKTDKERNLENRIMEKRIQIKKHENVVSEK